MKTVGMFATLYSPRADLFPKWRIILQETVDLGHTRSRRTVRFLRRQIKPLLS
jgi:hypothetical protein